MELISVIIPCYNHGNFLSTAIESVLHQSYSDKEIIVVDDGSIDNTKLVASKYNVTYVYQSNAGLAAARNTGIKNSKGSFLVFLDADDWLLKDALSVNSSYLIANKKAAFVSGSHSKVTSGIEIIEGTKLLTDDPYCCLLEFGNYIEMHASTMFQRWVFNDICYDVELKACEDYDLYLQIARRFPVLQHQEPIAAYHKHQDNMSYNYSRMLKYALKALYKQKIYLSNRKEKECFEKGVKLWIDLYCRQIYWKHLNILQPSDYINTKEDFYTLWKYKKLLFFQFLVDKPIIALKSLLKKAFF